MPRFATVSAVLCDVLSRRATVRSPEPDLVMDDPEKVVAYIWAGRENGVMASVYLFHCAQICEILCPGDTVIDLACGPATQLAMVARLNPETHFLGLDISDDMLRQAKNHIDTLGLKNVKLQKMDICHLDGISDQSVDAVFSTMALHHLPDTDHLDKTFAEVARVLRPNGGLYLVDFGHLNAEKTIHHMVYQHAADEEELFILDYLYSLRAAFWLSDFQKVWTRHLKTTTKIYSTFLMPFMIAIKSKPRHGDDTTIVNKLKTIREKFPPNVEADLKDLMAFFRAGGLRSRLLGK